MTPSRCSENSFPYWTNQRVTNHNAEFAILSNKQTKTGEFVD